MNSTSLEQRTYNDPVKQLSRQRLREFVRRNILSIIRPRDVRVVCFPGAEADGEEGLEIKEVYDALGIPRSNITGLEYDKKKAERLERAGLGIKVRHLSDTAFFAQASGKYHVISLDYTGHQTIQIRKNFAAISEKKLLGNFGVLATNFFIQRESARHQEQLTYDTMRHLVSREFYRILGAESPQTPDADDAIDEALCAIMAENHTSVEEEQVRLHEALERLRNRMYLRPGEVAPADLNLDITMDQLRSIITENTISAIGIGNKDRGPDFIVGIYKSIIAQNIQSQGAQLLSKALFNRMSEGYVLRDIERCTYRSNKGSNMLFDLMFFRQPLEYHRKVDSVIMMERGITFVNPKQYDSERLNDELNLLWDMHDELTRAKDIPGAEFLGSS